MPCRKKLLHRQNSDDPLVSSQNQTMLLAPLIDRGKTAHQSRVNRGFCFSVGLNKISFVHAFSERHSSDVSSMLWRVRERLVSFANSSVGIHSCPTPPRYHAMRPDPTRPCYVRVLDSTSDVIHKVDEVPKKVQGLLIVIVVVDPRDCLGVGVRRRRKRAR